MKVAIPSSNPGGLNSARSEHFGHCEIFTVVELEKNEVGHVDLLKNVPHGQGGCIAPVTLLRDAGVSAIIVSGMGARPMQGFSEAGIRVFFADKATITDVSGAILKFVEGGLPEMHPSQACQGSGTCHH